MLTVAPEGPVTVVSVGSTHEASASMEAKATTTLGVGINESLGLTFPNRGEGNPSSQFGLAQGLVSELDVGTH